MTPVTIGELVKRLPLSERIEFVQELISDAFDAELFSVHIFPLAGSDGHALTAAEFKQYERIADSVKRDIKEGNAWEDGGLVFDRAHIKNFVVDSGYRKPRKASK